MDVQTLQAWLDEDRADDDVTSRSVVPEAAGAVGRVVAREALVVAGTEPAKRVLEHLGASVEVALQDGEPAEPGELVLTAQGPARALLGGERLSLNLLGHLSGIATSTRAVVDAAHEANPSCQVLATRKTTPGLREIEHAAVRAGGATPHRADLSEALLVKENHLAFISVAEAVKAARDHAPSKTLVVEAETSEQAAAVARAGADGVLLDNFDPSRLEDTVELVKHIQPAMVVEASGGITQENIADYARFVDRVSLGAITHSARAVDLSMRIEPA